MSEVTDDATEPTSDVVPLLVPRDGVPDVITTAAEVAELRKWNFGMRLLQSPITPRRIALVIGVPLVPLPPVILRANPRGAISGDSTPSAP